MIQKIIDYLAKTKLPTAAISDGLGKTGVLHGIMPMCQPPLYAVGKVHVVHAINCSNWHLHDKARKAEPGSIVYVHCENCGDFAALGELVSLYCIKQLQAAAVVINGLVRDVAGIRGLPVWAKGVTPLGCFNAKPKLSEDDIAKMNDVESSIEGGIMVCDDSGVVVIDPNLLTQDTLDKMHMMKDREARWFKAMADGLSTFEIVCEGKY
jgi:4-hydroxy-4-methyl-2-oxoglutarate aldolase